MIWFIFRNEVFQQDKSTAVTSSTPRSAGSERSRSQSCCVKWWSSQVAKGGFYQIHIQLSPAIFKNCGLNAEQMMRWCCTHKLPRKLQHQRLCPSFIVLSCSISSFHSVISFHSAFNWPVTERHFLLHWCTRHQTSLFNIFFFFSSVHLHWR